MQLQFHKNVCPCLQRVKRQVQNQEQTQEIRLNDDMPDIGRVLGAWGQVLLRGKEWRNGAMMVSGGVQVKVLYMPEDEGTPQWADTWIPFQMKWDLPETQHDGIIRAQCLLRNVDARSTSARRLMVRACIGTMGEALLPGEFVCYDPENVPEDVQLLKNTYPFHLPQEAGEKTFGVDEVFTLPPSAPKLEKLIRYEMTPQILDKKVMSGKVVFRGTGNLHILYLTDSGAVQSWDFEVPFSQFGELEKEYDQDATAEIIPAVTGLELEVDEGGNLCLKAGLTGQYMISDRNLITVVEDAYSPKRKVEIETQQQQIPAILEQCTHTITSEQTLPGDARRMADGVFYPDHPAMLQRENGVEVELPGQFSVLYYDEDGNLQGTVARWEGSISLTAGSDTQMLADTFGNGKVQGDMGSPIQLQAELPVAVTGSARQGITIVTALELGEEIQPDPNRPSLILRRVANETLWDMAKKTGSTVAAIQEANALTEEPEKHKILLIPIV